MSEYLAPYGQQQAPGPVYPSAVVPAAAVHAPAPPAGMRVTGYVRALDGALLPQYGPVYEPPAPLPPPAPGLDPLAQRLLGAGVGGGVLAAGTGWGIGQAVHALAGLGTGAVMWLAILVVAARLGPALARPSTTVNKTVHNHNSWWGHSSTEN